MAQDASTGFRAERQRTLISEQTAVASRDHRVSPHCTDGGETTMIVAEKQVDMRLSAGIDWTNEDCAVCVVGPGGEALERFMIKHDRAGLKDLVRRLLRAGLPASRPTGGERSRSG